MKNNFADSVLKKIHRQKISPHERYYFVALAVLKVSALLMFLFLGMHSVAMVLHLVNNIEFLGFVLEQPRVLVKLIWFGVPLFWMVLAVALWVVIENLAQKTERAYRIPFWMIGVLALVLQVAGGFVMERSQIGERADQMFEKRMEWYHGAERINRRMERSPQKGFLVGMVLEIKSNELILLNDMDGKVWRVELIPNPRISYKMREGVKIGVVGEMIGNDEFVAERWRPLKDRPDGKRKGSGKRPPLFEGRR